MRNLPAGLILASLALPGCADLAAIKNMEVSIREATGSVEPIKLEMKITVPASQTPERQLLIQGMKMLGIGRWER